MLRRYSRAITKLTGDGANSVARFETWLRAAGRSASTVRTYSTVAGEFTAFVDTRGGMAGCGAGTVEAFVAALAGYQFKTVEQKLCALRSFLRFASGDGLVDVAVVDAVPAVKSRKQTRIPSVWDRAEVSKVLEAVDRGNPCGKRDYAMILLVTRLGLRGIDVKRLEFSDFDWPGNRLSVVQAKTGHRVWLPLLKDVGWAVIDYIRSGRPASDCPQVFIRHTAPIGPFSDQDHLHQILVNRTVGGHGHDLDQLLEVAAMVFGEASFGDRRADPRPRPPDGGPVGAVEGDRGGVVVQLGDVDPKPPDRADAQGREQARPVRDEQPVQGPSYPVVVEGRRLTRPQAEQPWGMSGRPGRHGIQRPAAHRQVAHQHTDHPGRLDGTPGIGVGQERRDQLVEVEAGKHRFTTGSAPMPTRWTSSLSGSTHCDAPPMSTV